MEGLLTPVSRTYRKGNDHVQLLADSQPTKPVAASKSQFQGSSAEEALEALRSQPDYETLVSVLKYLWQGAQGKQPFNILKPSPQGAQIVQILVTDIVPNYWTVLKEDVTGHKKNQDLLVLLRCLSSVTGLNAALAFLRALLQEARKNPRGLKQSHALHNIGFILDLLSQLLQPVDQARNIWLGTSSSEDNVGKVRALRQEFVSLLVGGKIVSLSAEAEDIIQQAQATQDSYWIADSKQYVLWIGHNLVNWIKSGCDDSETQLCADLVARALRLGHSETLVNMLFTGLVLRDKPSLFTKLLDFLPQQDQRNVLLAVLKLLSIQLPFDLDGSTDDYPLVWAAAGVLASLVETSQVRRTHLVSWLTDATGAGIGESCGIRRAAIAVLARDKDIITMVLEKSLSQFGDQLYTKHSPILQQEAHAQVLLISAGYVHRNSPIKLTILLRSGTFLNTISNRIAASQDRARFLGMVVGETLSGLVHGVDKKLDFHMDETNSVEGKWYKSLVDISDKVGPISPLQAQSDIEKPAKTPRSAKTTAKPAPRAPRSVPQPGFIIEELNDDEEGDEEGDDDLVPYAKPDSDTEDSDDDPTLISRNKPKAPVYIRDLITFLRDTENYDRQKLALTTAPLLIRRKAHYGTEVSSHAEELATLLIGLQDTYKLDDFHNLRLQGMIAVVISQPQRMGQWFAKTFFDGDYSLSQRASILIVLGLSGREIAGFDTSEYASASAFPTKQLPAKLEKIYALPSSSNAYTSSPSNLKALPATALDNISQSLSQKFLAPLAAEAADAVTGPDVLKLSSFTSRLQNPSTKGGSKPKNTGVRSIPNTTASLLSTSFFFPLTSRFQAALHSSSASSRGILFQPYLLTLYLKTLALLLHAAGPSTLALPQMTTELWDLLLGVRGQCLGEIGVTGAVLFGFMTLLDVNEGDMRGLCQQHGREVVETVEWVSGVFDRTKGGDAGGDGEENKVKMMAAGVLIRLREAIEKYRAVLMGDLIGFT